MEPAEGPSPSWHACRHHLVLTRLIHVGNSPVTRNNKGKQAVELAPPLSKPSPRSDGATPPEFEEDKAELYNNERPSNSIQSSRPKKRNLCKPTYN